LQVDLPFICTAACLSNTLTKLLCCRLKCGFQMDNVWKGLSTVIYDLRLLLSTT
jgi:hypothetical protein